MTLKKTGITSDKEAKEKSMLNKIAINKVDLVEGEELWDLVKKIREALGQQKAKLKKSLFLHGIYKSHIITRDFETGAFFKMDLKRDGEQVELSNMQEVIMQFLPKKKSVEKAEGTTNPEDLRVVELPPMVVMVKGDKLTDESIEAIQEVTKASPDVDEEAFFEAPIEKGFWGGVLD